MASQGNGKHILIVEDSPDLQHLIAHLLKREGYVLTKADNGSEALQALRSMPQPPALILQKDPKLAGIPTVVMTADADPAAKAAQMGIKNYVQKPIDIEQLLSMAQRVVTGP